MPGASADGEATHRNKQYTRLTDQRARDYLARCDADVVIGTRPGINVYVSRFAPRRALRIAQEHLRHDAHSERLQSVLALDYRTLDAVVTTTEADAEVYRRRTPLPGVRVTAVPNMVPAPVGIARDETTKVITAAGRLVRGKRFDLLIEAFSARGSHRYDAEPIVERYEALFAALRATRTRRAWARGRVRALGWTRRQTRRIRRAVTDRAPINTTRPAGP